MSLATLLLQGTPNTIDGLIVGYVVIGAIGLGYVISLIVRQANLKKDIALIEKLEQDED